MSWDIKQNLKTGDWEFDSIRDLQSVEAEHLIQQRIHVRLAVARGEFIYDREGTLGSRLRSVAAMGIPQSGPTLEMLIREALAPMEDIAISNIEVFTPNDGSGVVLDSRTIQARIDYTILFALDQDLLGDTQGQLSTQIVIPS